jgi:hypothetical protein
MSSFALKMLAMISMLTDHIGFTFEHYMPYSVFLLCRTAGRLAMPVFCFLIAEGLFHTRDAKKYLIRLALFAIVSEVPFDLMFSGQWLEYSRQNVGFTLFFGFLCILMFDSFAAKGRKLPALLSVLAAVLAVTLLRSDYEIYGVYYIFIFYYFRDKPKARIAAFTAGVFLSALDSLMAGGHWHWPLVISATVLAAGPITLYNNERGKDGAAMRTAFYMFYPLHMTLLFAVSLLIPAP